MSSQLILLTNVINIVGFLNHNSENGSYMHSPFKFQHFNLSSVNLSVNGRNLLNNPLQLNFAEDTFIQAFHNLQAVCDKIFVNEGNNISREEFKSSICFLAVDNTPDLCPGEGLHLSRNSTTTLDLSFHTALTETVTALVYTKFDDLLQIDKARNTTRASIS